MSGVGDETAETKETPWEKFQKRRVWRWLLFPVLALVGLFGPFLAASIAGAVASVGWRAAWAQYRETWIGVPVGLMVFYLGLAALGGGVRLIGERIPEPWRKRAA